MSAARRARLPILAALLLAALARPVAAAPAAPELAPYRALIGAADGERLLRVARAAMSERWSETTDSSAAVLDNGPAWPGPPCGVYVSLVAGRGTRACVGAAAPPAGTLGEAVRTLAIQALTADRRRPPVRAEELGSLQILIAFAGEGEPIADPMSVRTASEGLLIETPRGAIAFLPGEARTVAWALREARRVGVLEGATADAHYRRFPVVILKEPPRPARGQEDPNAIP